MIKRGILSILALTLAFSGFTAIAGTSAADAAPRGCPDVELVFARGTIESAPPVGLTGLSFADALRRELPGKSVRVYGVQYPASDQFQNRLRFAQTVRDGVVTTQNHIKRVVAVCPGTKIVLGGYSQGAVVAGYAVANAIDVPVRYKQYARFAPTPLPAPVARHITAVVLFAPPSDRFIRDVGAPPIRVAAAYRGKTVRYCIPGDTICDGAPVGGPNVLHVLYSVNGMADAAARYVHNRL
ncbi:cutinase family protein [Gordonia sp. ABSL1-1]|uniref:cutinase family protein n=1 Tax=Gordonia sp. ABSL1-1 TaxID=3053923 RepID=UPI002573EE0D|nr:cutinase family protein [Gordonia sp. ABSL1-1]MDL9938903.1 cutinase family protein [Gordonia sp. ABSL1-1]